MSSPLKILVVEDEYITQKTITVYLTEMGYDVVGTAMNSEEAIEILQSHTIEFALLDITIQGDKNGIWLADYIQQHFNIPHVFLTAYSDNDTIRQALATNPYGYLIKPFQKAELFSAIEIAVQNYNKTLSAIQKPKDDFLFIKHNEVFEKVFLNEVEYIESQKNYLLIVTAEKTFRHRSTITDFINRLPDNFLKTHKGFIVNLNKIKSFGNNYIIIGQHKIPISKTYKEEISQKLNDFISKG
ncbi:response regulator [Flavobacterium enshiense]|uniref:LytR/AlgR family response regulator transcription factor n=1 Tax=Flavobacterium enshiense TaxID=1341165 RepID=UPI00345CF200